MPPPLQVVLLDVNETLSDLEPLRARLEAVGAPGHLLDPWFAGTLRDGFALAAGEASAPFLEVGAATLRTLLAPLPGLAVPLEDAVQQVTGGLSSLGVHPDVPEGLRLLADGGLRVVPFTNGAAASAQQLLERAGLADLAERFLSVEDAGRWKPHARSYAYALGQCGVQPDQAALVAVHPWDTDGASRSGLSSGWVDRRDVPYPDVFLPPDVSGPDLPAVARALLSR